MTVRAFYKNNVFDGVVAWFGSRKAPEFLERAEIAAKQRAGFDVIYEYALDQVASFRWGEGGPDFTFFVSFNDPEAVLVNAVSYGDIFGLTMTSISNAPKIVVEAKYWLTKQEFGRNAHRFRKILLTFPDFDTAPEELFNRFEF